MNDTVSRATLKLLRDPRLREAINEILQRTSDSKTVTLTSDNATPIAVTVRRVD